jgi:hypothetical protein
MAVLMRDAKQVAKILEKIYETEFGGKDRGRFQISREGLREISGRRRLEDTVLAAIINEAYERGLVVTDIGEGFSVIEEEVMRNYRKVPKKITASYGNKGRA